MIKAQQARERTSTPDQVIARQMEQQLEILDKEVRKAAADGLTSITLDGTALQETIAELQVMGYTVSVTDKNTTLSW